MQRLDDADDAPSVVLLEHASSVFEIIPVGFGNS